MNAKITVNCHEFSQTVTRPNGETVDFVSMKDEVIIGVNHPDGSFTDIVLSLQEAETLQELLATALG
jgi:hypothetical protein